MNDLSRTLVLFGIIIIAAGLIINFIPKGGIPRLPGDIYIKKGNFSFYFPWVSSLLISAVLSLVFYLFFRK